MCCAVRPDRLAGGEVDQMDPMDGMDLMDVRA